MDAQGLQHIGDMLRASIDRLAAVKPLSETEAPPIDEYVQRRVERYNSSAGNLNEQDGYNCDKCQNRGYSMRAVFRSGMWYEVCDTCECMKVRKSIARMKASGLENTIKAQRLSTFKAGSYWQEKMLEKLSIMGHSFYL